MDMEYTTQDSILVPQTIARPCRTITAFQSLKRAEII